MNSSKRIHEEVTNITEKVKYEITNQMSVNSPINLSLNSKGTEETECQGHQLTNEIDYIRIQFIGTDNPIIQDLMNRVTNLEDEMKLLKVKESRIIIRVLLEKGRNLLWENHKNEYMNCEVVLKNRKEYIKEKMHYNSNKILFQKPDSWEHFLFVLLILSVV